MQQATDILKISAENKKCIHKYFYGGSSYLIVKLKSLKKHELNALLLLTVETPAELCKFLKTSFFELEELLNNPIYKNYAIKKKKGGERQIFAPEKKLKLIQKQLNYYLQAYYLWVKPDEVHGFVINPHYLGRHCNIVANAKVHTRKKAVLNIDLKDFFPSISALQVKQVFTSSYFGFNEQIATALTLLTTYEGKLPIGAPTSPVISNFICFQLDNDLKSFSDANGMSFTRYADDLTFSSESVISNDDILDIINLIKKNGFEINEKKLRLKLSDRKQTVTGLTVNQKVNVDRKLLKRIRAMLHDLILNGIDMATQKHFDLSGEVQARHQIRFICRLEGYINFIGQVRGKNDSLYLSYKSILTEFFHSENWITT